MVLKTVYQGKTLAADTADPVPTYSLPIDFHHVATSFSPEFRDYTIQLTWLKILLAVPPFSGFWSASFP